MIEKRAVLALTVVFILSLPAVTPRIYASDEIQYFSFLRSLWVDRDLAFDNEYRHFYEAGVARSALFRNTFLERTSETGRRINFGTIGCALLWAPFYAGGDLVARSLRMMGQPVATDGYSFPYIAAVCYGSAAYGFLAILLSYVSALRVLHPPHAHHAHHAHHGNGRLAALAAALAVWLGTPLLFYMYVAPPMAHATSAFTVSAFVLAWIVVRERWSRKGMVLLGGLAALMTMVREQDLFFVVGPALDLAWTLARGRAACDSGGATGASRSDATRRLAAGALLGVVTFAMVFVPQAVAYLVLNGRLGPSRLVTRKMTWTAPHALEVLGSPEHGFLWWTPLAALGIAGLVMVARRGVGQARLATATDFGSPQVSRLAVCMLAMIALQIYIAGSVESWTVAGAFGQRRFVGLTPLLAIGLTAFIRAIPSRGSRLVATFAIVACMWWNVGLIAQFGSGLMDRQRLELSRIAYNNFVVVPRRLPELAYRYVVDRESFYGGATVPR